MLGITELRCIHRPGLPIRCDAMIYPHQPVRLCSNTPASYGVEDVETWVGRFWRVASWHATLPDRAGATLPFRFKSTAIHSKNLRPQKTVATRTRSRNRRAKPARAGRPAEIRISSDATVDGCRVRLVSSTACSPRGVPPRQTQRHRERRIKRALL